MGYNFNIRASDIHIPQEAHPLIAREYVARTNNRRSTSKIYQPMQQVPLRDLFYKSVGISTEIDEDGCIVGFVTDSPKLGEGTYDMLACIRPYVLVGSYIECSGDGDELWRWVFTVDDVVRITPTIAWPSVDVAKGAK